MMSGISLLLGHHTRMPYCGVFLYIPLKLLQELKICEAIINMFHLIPAASVKMIEPLTALTLKGEKALLIGKKITSCII